MSGTSVQKAPQEQPIKSAVPPSNTQTESKPQQEGQAPACVPCSLPARPLMEATPPQAREASALPACSASGATASRRRATQSRTLSWPCRRQTWASGRVRPRPCGRG